jgi:hypothetical protein
MKEKSQAEPIVLITTELSDTSNNYASGLTKYLNSLGLPSDGILVSVKEQRRVIATLPEVVAELETGLKKQSFYLAKFVAACGAGLFDAALNFVWDETVLQLRAKIAQFDLEYFVNSTISDPDRRKKITTPEDLVQLDDWELIRGAHATGILSEIGFKHLDYIRDMRNWASAAHPNQNQITGLQLISWLETCIKEVIGKEPSAPAIEVRRLLHNIREQKLTSRDVAPIEAALDRLTADVSQSLLRTIFGMFCDPKAPVDVKQNVRLIAKSVWKIVSEEARNEIGIKFGTYAANADVARAGAAKDFLTTVEGLSYLPQDALALEISEMVQNLQTAHLAFNNFYNEFPHAKALMGYISQAGTIPAPVRFSYVKTVVMCYIGNGYGVSVAAYAYYQQMVDRFTDDEIWTAAALVTDSEVASRLSLRGCRDRFRKLITHLKGRTSNPAIIAAIDFVLGANDEQIPVIGATTQMRKLLHL